MAKEENKQQELNAFGFDEKTAKSIMEREEILPVLDLSKLGENDTYSFTVLSKEPVMVEYKDKKTGKDKKEPTIKVMCNETKQLFSVWISAQGLREGFFRLFNENKENLENLSVLVGRYKYLHPDYGEVMGYRVKKND